ncbi:chromatin-remodeling ATPase INO80-like [Phragmites australis]|uniref:chromatin-remodeling ATPase INO80-like n=1 Tax=Phragmites australis TaxID=29695 RepID=UPI002D76761F|nr:chromatin-remodeling ATPase INO80-like [Phragmites australis]
MDPRRAPPRGGGANGGGLSYSTLFSLEPLLNFRVPVPEDVAPYGNSSPNGSASSEGQGSLLDQYNGINDASHGLHLKRKRHLDGASDDDEADAYNNQITEEHYRTMLSEHVQKYRRSKFKEGVFGSDPPCAAIPQRKHKNGGKKTTKHRGDFRDVATLDAVEASHEFNGTECISTYGGFNKLVASLDSTYLDMGDNIRYLVPEGYDKLAPSLNLPVSSDIRVEEHFFKDTLDLRTIAAMLGFDQKFEATNRGGLAEPLPQYESLQERVKIQKFSLKVTEDPFAIPEGTAGRIRRSIISEAGNLQVHYVKVLEKGDTYEIIERSLPKKQITKKEPSVIMKEESEKAYKLWHSLATKSIPKHHRNFNALRKKRQVDAKRFSDSCQREVKLKVSRSLKLMRCAAIRTRKLARDMLIFWKRVDKEQYELRKKEEREAVEALKREEELREAKRQQQRLNFLLSQTELYSHFMRNKAGGSAPPDEVSVSEPDEEEEDPEEAELKREALRAARHAVSQQKRMTNAFDSEIVRLRQTSESGIPTEDSSTMDSSKIDLLHPSTMPEKSSVLTPELFKGVLKEYQLKGLQWLVNCYEQGLNGILADEMGLGKTIQAMAFLAHLAEDKNIWGPFLVVAPASVVNNWAEELIRFCPDLMILPYWGSERLVLRKNINPKRLYRRDASFHILITNYQILVNEEKLLRRVKWQYMVLDEAQAIKSSSSQRWKTLLSFNCRNRLLLTGTPIQNNMAELWALLHFIMPTLFDSHEQFNEWFSKGIEGHAEHGGALNEHQLSRLHAILKPFMLRRVKIDVIAEMTEKKEEIVPCKLSSRQQVFYQAIKNKISLNELLDGRRGNLNEKKLLSLMNIVMQLRKVCNHPELFERNEGSSYFYFADIPNSLLSPPFGELHDVHYAGKRNPITFEIPKLVYEGIICNMEISGNGCGFRSGYLNRLFNIFLPSNIHFSAFPEANSSNESVLSSGAFGFIRLTNLSPVEASFLATCSLFERLAFLALQSNRNYVEEIVDAFLDSEGPDLQFSQNDVMRVRAVARLLLSSTKADPSLLRTKIKTGPSDSPYEALVLSHHDRLVSNIRLLRSAYAFIPPARAPPINVWCADRNFAYKFADEMHDPWAKKLFLGFARTSEFNGPRQPVGIHPLIQELHTDLPIPEPMLQLPYRIFGSSPPMSNFDPAKMLTDSGKLHTLDILLRRLRAEGHRVLLFAQMTKMLDILEDYMNFRKFKYFRLDGSSAISDRRDMVRDFQNRNDIFVFLLSTRAGGLGINLTAADTVIFYEIDWNPTQDQQAMDRTHRLGQTKEVTVYRLICKDTIEEKILQRAKQKNAVQELVMKGKHVQDDHLMKQEDVVSLLLDDTQIAHKLKEISMQAKERLKKRRAKAIKVDKEGDLTLEELDDTTAEAVEQDNTTSKKKKKSHTQPKSHDNDNVDKNAGPPTGGDNPGSGHTENEQITKPRPKRSKRLMKSMSDDKEPAAATVHVKQADEAENDTTHDFDGTEEVQDRTPA